MCIEIQFSNELYKVAIEHYQRLINLHLSKTLQTFVQGNTQISFSRVEVGLDPLNICLSYFWKKFQVVHIRTKREIALKIIDYFVV